MDKETKKMLKEVLEELANLRNEIHQLQISQSVIPPSLKPTEKNIAVILENLGIRHNLLGYTYWVFALSEINVENKKAFHITTDLYPAIAEKFQTTPCNVDRNLRHAIKSAFNRNTTLMTTLFPNYSKSPTTSEFFFRMIDYIKGI